MEGRCSQPRMAPGNLHMEVGPPMAVTHGHSPIHSKQLDKGGDEDEDEDDEDDDEEDADDEEGGNEEEKYEDAVRGRMGAIWEVRCSTRRSNCRKVSGCTAPPTPPPPPPPPLAPLNSALSAAVSSASSSSSSSPLPSSFVVVMAGSVARSS